MTFEERMMDKVIATAQGRKRFPGLYCCKWECEKEAEFYIVGNLNAGVDNDTHACKVHVGELLGTSDYLTGENTVFDVSIIPESELARYREAWEAD